MTLDEIMNGKGHSSPGLLGLISAYIDTLDVKQEELTKINGYLNLIRLRANGSLLTPATWIRNFVQTHPAYARDSVVTQEINYDLIVAIDEIEQGVRSAPDLLPVDYMGGEADKDSVYP